MPIKIDGEISACDQEEFRALDYAVMGIAFQTHNDLGRLLPEKAYQKELAHQLARQGFNARTEVKCTVSHRDFSHEYFLDLVVNDTVVYELKTVHRLNQDHDKQVLNYLFLTNTRHGKLLNFRPGSLQSRFVNTGYDRQSRRDFIFNDADGTEGKEHPLRLLLIDLLKDWGWGLSLRLYEEALRHPLLKDCFVEQVELMSENASLGTMELTVMSGTAVLHLSAIREGFDYYENSLSKRLSLTPLNTTYWINLNRNEILLKTLNN